MFKDLNDLSINTILSCDICIVGSGPAGISVAKKLLESNSKVILLESGGLNPSFAHNELNKGVNSGSRFLSLDASRMRCFGGASRIWAGVCAPFNKEDFEQKPYVPLSGWPIQKEDLDQYYKEAANMLGISYDLFDHNQSINYSFSGLSFPRLGGKNSFLSTTVRQTSDLNNRNFGEKYKKLFSDSNNVDVLFHSTVSKLNVSKNGKKIISIEAQDLTSKKCTIDAKKYVLAAGALENPRLLLHANDLFKNGIGNESGFVGSCFMSHPGISGVADIYKTSEGVCIKEGSYSNDLIYQFASSSSEQFNSQILNHGFDLKPYADLANFSTYKTGRIKTEYKKLLENFNFIQSVEKTLCRFSGEYASNLWELGVALEQEPTHRNHLTLNSSKQDFFGVPLIDMFWDEISDREKMTVNRSVKLLARELGKKNSGRVKFTEDFLSGKAFEQEDSVNHHIGTTRMSESIDKGVVDKNCKVFSISNLFLAGSSVFPTSSIVNPTYTIIALGLRLGDHLKKITS